MNMRSMLGPLSISQFIRLTRLVAALWPTIRDELPCIERELAKLLAAIKAGGPIQAIVDDVKRPEARKAN